MSTFTQEEEMSPYATSSQGTHSAAYRKRPFGQYGPMVEGTNHHAIELWLEENRQAPKPEKWTFDNYTDDQLKQLSVKFLDKLYQGDVPGTVTRQEAKQLNYLFHQWLDLKAHAHFAQSV